MAASAPPAAATAIIRTIKSNPSKATGITPIAVYDADTMEWNSGRRPRNKGGYVPVPPTDTLTEVRNDIVRHLHAAGIKVDVHHHEVASGGQCEIGITLA